MQFDNFLFNVTFTLYLFEGVSSLPERPGVANGKHSCNNIKAIPTNLRNELKLSYFYQKYAEAYGIPVLASNKASVNAIRRACYVLRFFLANENEIRNVFYKKNARVVVLANNEQLTNVPEFTSIGNSYSPLRGLSATINTPVILIGEENAQCSPWSDKFK